MNILCVQESRPSNQPAGIFGSLGRLSDLALPPPRPSEPKPSRSSHKFTILSVCHDLKRLEEDEEVFRKVIEEVEAADGVLWAFPPP